MSLLVFVMRSKVLLRRKSLRRAELKPIWLEPQSDRTAEDVGHHLPIETVNQRSLPSPAKPRRKRRGRNPMRAIQNHVVCRRNGLIRPLEAAVNDGHTAVQLRPRWSVPKGRFASWKIDQLDPVWQHDMAREAFKCNSVL